MSQHPDRLKRLVDSLDRLQIDALLITDETNVHYLCGFTGDSSYLMVTPQGTTILSDGRYDTQIAAECPDLTAAIRPPGVPMPDLTRSVLVDSGLQRVGIESEHLSLATFRFLEEGCDSTSLVELSGVVEALRVIKDADEIAATRKAIEVAERAFHAVLPMVTEQSSELAIAHDLESKMRFLGASGCSFPPIVAWGRSSALPHYLPRDVRSGDATTLLIDWGAFHGRYASDLTRTLHRAGVSDRFRHAYDAVLEAQLAAIDAMKPGAVASQVDAAARSVLERAGIAEAFVHGLGHGVGLQIHEAPRISYESREILQPGMIITVEPGVYFEGDFGVRIEDDVLITESGCEVLTGVPKGLDDCRFML